MNIFKKLFIGTHIFCKWDQNHKNYPKTLVCKICGCTKIEIGKYYGIADDGVGKGLPIYETTQMEV